VELNVKQIIGKPVVILPQCIIKGWVKTVFIDLPGKKICGYECMGKNPLMVTAKLAVSKNTAASRHCVMVLDPNEMRKKTKCRERFLPYAIRASRSGEDIGFVTNIVFDGRTGNINAIEVSQGLFEDLKNGRSYFESFTVDMLDKNRIAIN
jgi:uncharacterized protein YrrD